MKNLLMKKEFEDFLQNHGFYLDDDNIWRKEYAKIFLDFVDEEGNLCMYTTSCEYAEVTDKYLIIYEVRWCKESENPDALTEVFKVELKNIKSARISIEAGK